MAKDIATEGEAATALGIDGDHSVTVDKAHLHRLVVGGVELAKEMQELRAQAKEHWSGAKDAGFDTKALKTLVKERMRNADQVDAERSTLDLYRDILGDGPLFDHAA